MNEVTLVKGAGNYADEDKNFGRNTSKFLNRAD